MSNGTYEKNRYCTFCGQPFAANQPWPRLCAVCGQISYINPLPVGVLLLPVLMTHGRGVLAIQRNGGRRKGLLALPGGFLEMGESWQAGTARELWEETNVRIDPEGIRPLQVLSAPDGTLLIFGLAQPVRAADLPPFTPSAEISDRVVITTPMDLAFPLHTKVLRDYFESEVGGK